MAGSGQFSRKGKQNALHAVLGLAFTVTNKALTSNVATLTIGSHDLQIGDTVDVTGVDATFNGTWVITAVAGTTISYADVAANVGSVASGGTVAFVATYAGFVALTTTAPTDSAIGTEYAATGYARQAIAWTVPTAADPPVSSNTALLTFGPFTAGTGSTISYAELTTQSSGTITATQNMLAWWTLGTPKTPANGDTATIAIAALSMSFTSPVG